MADEEKPAGKAITIVLADDKAIVAAAELHDAGEIAVGSRGQGRMRSAVGSVCQELLQLADRPVLVVPANAAGSVSPPPAPQQARRGAPA